MRRRLSGVATLVGALLFDPLLRLPDPMLDHEDVRLERATVASVSAALPVPPSPLRGVGHDIPLSGDRKHLIVDGTLNGTVSGPMLIDTGASYCVVTRRTARKLGLKPHARGVTVPVATANGQVDADFIELAAVELRDARLGGVDAVIMDAVEPPLIGIIGLNFLTRFRFSVDLAEGTLRLEP